MRPHLWRLGATVFDRPAPVAFRSLAGKAVSLSLLLAATLSSPAQAMVDAFVNTSNYVAGQPSVLSVDGIVGSGGTSTSITGAAITLVFDPDKVTISNPTGNANLGWSLQAYNIDTPGQAIFVLTNSSGTYGEGQTTSGTIVSFTLTPANGSVDVTQCATLKMDGMASNLADQDFYTVYPSDPCAGRFSPLGGAPSSGGGKSAGSSSSGGSGPTAPLGSCDPYLQNGVRILKIAAGLMAPLPSGNPNLTIPRTEQDVETLDMTNDGKLSIEDAIVSFKVRGTEPAAAWSDEFVGNTLVMYCGDAANATAMPAMSRLNPSNPNSPWIATFPMGDRNGKNYKDPRVKDIDNGVPVPSGGTKSSNTNNVYVLQDLGNGVFGYRPNWPQPMRDGPYGVALADFAGTGSVNVIASNFQDNNTLTWGEFADHSRSRPYVWTVDAGPVNDFANADNPDSPNPNDPSDPDEAIGAAPGHTNTAPPVWDIDGPGGWGPLILFPAEGEINQQTLLPAYGGIWAFDATGVRAFHTQSDDTTQPWFLAPWDQPSPGLADARLEAPIVLPKRAGRTDRAVVAVSCTGLAFAWDTAGNAFSGFRPQVMAGNPPGTRTDFFPALNSRASCITPIAAADPSGTGTGGFDVIAGTGNYIYGLNDGAIYCWNDAGQQVWRYPGPIHNPQLPGDWIPSISSGVSVGRANRYSSTPCVVAADAQGKVYAIDITTGSLVWSYQIEKYPGQAYPNNLSRHPAHRIVLTQPLVADINNDGVQEVIVGNLDGQVYAIQQKPSPNQTQGQLIAGFPKKTIEGPQSTWKVGTTTYTETHGEQIGGIGLAPMKASAPNNAYLLVTTLRPALAARAVAPVDPIGGHAYLFDLGANSWNGNLADWPQYQQNAQRTGYFPGP